MCRNFCVYPSLRCANAYGSLFGLLACLPELRHVHILYKMWMVVLLRNHAGRCSLFNVQVGWRSPLVIALLLPYLYSSNNKIICFFFLYIFNLLKFHLFYLFTHQNRREKQETKKATTQLKFVFGISRYFSYILGTCILYKCRSHVQLHWNPLFLSAHSMRLLIR